MLAQSRKINILEKLAMDPLAASKTRTIAAAAGKALSPVVKPVVKVKPTGDPQAAAKTRAIAGAAGSSLRAAFGGSSATRVAGGK